MEGQDSYSTTRDPTRLRQLIQTGCRPGVIELSTIQNDDIREVFWELLVACWGWLNDEERPDVDLVQIVIRGLISMIITRGLKFLLILSSLERRQLRQGAARFPTTTPH